MGKTINRGTSGLNPIKGSNGVHKADTSGPRRSSPSAKPHITTGEMPNTGKIGLGALSCSEGGKSC